MNINISFYKMKLVGGKRRDLYLTYDHPTDTFEMC